jgi:integrase/recombinase XerD
MTTTVNPADKPSSEIIQRMIGDMKIRHLAPATIKCYSNHIKKFAEFLDKSLDQATTEDIRSFQLHLIQIRKLAWSSFNQAVCSLRFLYNVTIPRPWTVTMIPFGKKAKRLPTVLSREEVEALITCTRNRKHRTILMTLYATGLRISEALNLQIADVDSHRMQLKVTRGKGNKMRLVPFSPRLLTELREYWRDFRPKTYLFPGQSSNLPLGMSAIQEAIKGSAAKVKIIKPVTPHVLRHSYATALLEAGVDILTISRLLGHASLTTTMIYLHVRQPHLQSTPSPLDWLPVSQLPTWQQANQPDNQPDKPKLNQL